MKSLVNFQNSNISINKLSKFGKFAGLNRDNLSKSIILHHTKNQNLLNTAGRYNNDLFIQDIDDNEEEEENISNGDNK